MILTIPIIIVNWNGIEDTEECLDSLWNQTYQDFEVYLVDNGSEEKEILQLQEKFGNNEKINLLLNNENLGFTKACNKMFPTLIKTGNYKYIALLNNDTVVERDWLKTLLQCAEEHNADMVSSRMVNYYQRDRLDNAGHFMLNTGEIMPLGYNMPVDTFSTVIKNSGACAGACLYSVKMIEKIGFFDEYFHTGYEDAEYGLRALLTGHKLLLEPKAVVYHKMSKSINKIRDLNYMVQLQRNIFYTYLKLLPLPVILFNVVFIIFRTVVVLCLFAIFLRLRYIKIYYKAFHHLIFNDLHFIRENRKAFFKRHKTISFQKIINSQQFFLWDNIKRFFRYFIKGERTIFEK